MSFIPKAQEIYKHFKGNLYQIVAVATHTETEEQLVIYQAMYGDFKIYARPLPMFVGKVDKEKYPQATQEYRFELLGHVGECLENAGNVEAIVEQSADIPVEKTAIFEEKEEPQPFKIQEPQMEVETTGVSAWEEPQIDPMVLAFLDAQTHQERLNILASLHHRITDSMLLTMAIASDIELSEGTTQEKYDELRSCLLTLDRYEIQRLK